MKGGHGSSGPPPDPNALRRERDGGDWITLPATGREGPTPAWPLSRALKRETELWEREWRRPQAVQWERNEQELEVALYVRNVAAAEKRDALVGTRTLVVRQQETLGLSQPGLARNRWKIGTVAPDGATQAPARAGLRVVAGGAG